MATSRPIHAVTAPTAGPSVAATQCAAKNTELMGKFKDLAKQVTQQDAAQMAYDDAFKRNIAKLKEEGSGL